MTQLPTLVPYGGVIPDKLTQTATEFANAVHPFMRFYHTDTVPQINDFSVAMNTLSTEITDMAQQVSDDKDAVADMKEHVNAAVNYAGDWIAAHSYATGQSVTYGGMLYVSKVDDNTTEPTSYTTTAEWLWVGSIGEEIIVVAGDFTAANNVIVGADTSVGGFTVTLPASPATGDTVQVMDVAGVMADNPITIGRNGSTIMGLAEDMTIDTNNVCVEFVFINNDWRIK